MLEMEFTEEALNLIRARMYKMPVIHRIRVPTLREPLPGLPAPGVEAPIIPAPGPMLLSNAFEEADPVLAGHVFELPKKARAPKLVDLVVYPFPDAGDMSAPVAEKSTKHTPAAEVAGALKKDVVEAPTLEVAPVRKIVRRKKAPAEAASMPAPMPAPMPAKPVRKPGTAIKALTKEAASAAKKAEREAAAAAKKEAAAAKKEAAAAAKKEAAAAKKAEREAAAAAKKAAAAEAKAAKKARRAGDA